MRKGSSNGDSVVMIQEEIQMLYLHCQVTGIHLLYVF